MMNETKRRIWTLCIFAFLVFAVVVIGTMQHADAAFNREDARKIDRYETRLYVRNLLNRPGHIVQRERLGYSVEPDGPDPDHFWDVVMIGPSQTRLYNGPCGRVSIRFVHFIGAWRVSEVDYYFQQRPYFNGHCYSMNY